MGIFDSIGKKIESRESGIRVSDLLALPRELRKIMNHVIRNKEITVEGAAEHLGVSVDDAQQMLNTLVEKGYLHSEKKADGEIYCVHYGRTHPKDIPGSLWAALGEKVEE